MVDFFVANWDIILIAVIVGPIAMLHWFAWLLICLGCIRELWRGWKGL